MFNRARAADGGETLHSLFPLNFPQKNKILLFSTHSLPLSSIFALFTILTFLSLQDYFPPFITHRSQQLRGGRVQIIGQVGGELDAAAQVKVTDLDRRQLLRAHAQNVLRLQIAMRDALLVQKVQP